MMHHCTEYVWTLSLGRGVNVAASPQDTQIFNRILAITNTIIPSQQLLSVTKPSTYITSTPHDMGCSVHYLGNIYVHGICAATWRWFYFLHTLACDYCSVTFINMKHLWLTRRPHIWLTKGFIFWWFTLRTTGCSIILLAIYQQCRNVKNRNSFVWVAIGGIEQMVIWHLERDIWADLYWGLGLPCVTEDDQSRL